MSSGHRCKPLARFGALNGALARGLLHISKQTGSQFLMSPWGRFRMSLDTDSPAIEFARCFLRLANLPNFAFDRLSRYEATLWRQADQILFALDTLDRRKPQERRRRFPFCD
jgi:hypothetical protein